MKRYFFSHPSLLKHWKTCITGRLLTLCIRTGGARTSWELRWAPRVPPRSAASHTASHGKPPPTPSHSCSRKPNSLFLLSTLGHPYFASPRLIYSPVCIPEAAAILACGSSSSPCPSWLTVCLQPAAASLALTQWGSVIPGSPVSAPCWHRHRFMEACMDYSLAWGSLHPSSLITVRNPRWETQS